MNENEARSILAQNKMERGIEDNRSCLQIVEDLELVAQAGIVVEPVVDAIESIELRYITKCREHRNRGSFGSCACG